MKKYSVFVFAALLAACQSQSGENGSFGMYTADCEAIEDELERAVRHSMVVIDAEKHKLDWQQSEIDNNIQGLKEKYQRKINPDGSIHVGGSSTIVSRAKGEKDVPKTTGQPKINQKGKSWYDPNRPEGSLIYTTAKPEL